MTSDRPTFLLGWIDTLVEAPVLTPTGNLDNVELTHNCITLGVTKRQFKTVLAYNFGHTMYVACCLSHHMEVLYINKDQCSIGTVIQNVLWMNTAATG